MVASIHANYPHHTHFLAVGCSTFQQAGIPLQPSVAKFNDHLRWKRYDAAARLITSEEQPTFYEALSEVEETLDIQNIEVRHVAVLETEPLETRVIVRSESANSQAPLSKRSPKPKSGNIVRPAAGPC